MEVPWTTYVVHSLQFLLGGVFLVAATAKVREPSRFISTLRKYELVPYALCGPVAAMVMAAESFVAISLLWGWAVEIGVSIAGSLLAVFAVAVGINLRRGRVVPCGCFGSVSEQISSRTLARIGLLILAVAGLIAMLTATRTSSGLAILVRDGAGGLGQVALILAFAAFLLVLGAWVLHIPELKALLHQQFDGDVKGA